MSAINSIRETFKEQDIIRVHPIITQGGNAVNAIADSVVLESFVRGRTFEAIADANCRVNRALIGAALSIGANIDIQDMPRYSPLINSEGMKELANDAAKIMPDVPAFFDDKISSGSTDLGDLSLLMPVIHGNMPGAKGIAHGNNYYIEDPELVCVGSAKWQLAMLYLLLKDEGKRAKEIIAGYEPYFTSKEEFFEALKQFECSGERIEYSDFGATVKL